MVRSSALFGVLLVAAIANAQVVPYTDEAAFLTELSNLGYLTVTEGFEDDAVWGDVRTTVPGGPQTAPSVTSQGITWSANNPASGVTTGSGPARTGEWGFFELPHGDPTAGIHDGWIMTGSTPLYAVGGWIETNTFGARVNLVLDGVTVVDFEDTPLDYAHQFYGVISTEGFLSCEVVETEAVPGDQWFYIFGDDFTFGVAQGVPVEQSGLPRVARIDVAPNPFNPRTTISVRVPVAAHVDVGVYDLAGRLVAILAERAFPAGEHILVWSGRDSRGRAAPSGAYIVRARIGSSVASRKVMLAR
jgi:hypothetical protein